MTRRGKAAHVAIPSEILEWVQHGWPLAAELPPPAQGMRAFVVVLAHFPDPRPRDPQPAQVRGYEVRRLEHNAKYTEDEWGWDWDLVLDDPTTRVKRVLLDRPDAIEGALSRWLDDPARLRDAYEFDSALLSSRLEYYLDRPEDRPHLWL